MFVRTTTVYCTFLVLTLGLVLGCHGDDDSSARRDAGDLSCNIPSDCFRGEICIDQRCVNPDDTASDAGGEDAAEQDASEDAGTVMPDAVNDTQHVEDTGEIPDALADAAGDTGDTAGDIGSGEDVGDTTPPVDPGGAEGVLDHTFGERGGIVVTPVNPSNPDGARAVALQSDGKIVVVGYTNRRFEKDALIVLRYDSFGTLDPGFGDAGMATVIVDEAFHAEGHAVVVRDDGTIVAGGAQRKPDGTQTDFLLAYLDERGQIEQIVTESWSTFDRISELAVDADGNVLAAGVSRRDGRANIAVARFSSDGALDSAFGVNGLATVAFGTADSYAHGLVIQPDAKIVVGGYGHNNSHSHFALARILPNGEPDPEFGSQGRVASSVSAHSHQAYALALQSDGKLLAAGKFSLGAAANYADDFAVVRYLSTGQIDTTFGTNGRTTISFDSEYDKASALLVERSGRIIVIGDTGVFNLKDIALVRLMSDGQFDTSFGVDGTGKVVTSVGDRQDHAFGAALQDDGKILIVGESMGVTSHFDVMLLRYR